MHKIKMVTIVAQEDFFGANQDMKAGKSYEVPADKAAYWISQGVAKAYVVASGGLRKDVKGPKVSK